MVSESCQLALFESPSPRQIGQCCWGTVSTSEWKPKLFRSWSDLSSASSGCPASGRRVGPFDKSLKEGMERGRVEGELQDKSRVVLQGLIMRAAGLVSWMLCLCWSGWLQADVANEGGAVVC